MIRGTRGWFGEDAEAGVPGHEQEENWSQKAGQGLSWQPGAMQGQELVEGVLLNQILLEFPPGALKSCPEQGKAMGTNDQHPGVGFRKSAFKCHFCHFRHFIMVGLWARCLLSTSLGSFLRKKGKMPNWGVIQKQLR